MRIQIYVALVTAIAIAMVALQDWDGLVNLPPEALIGFGFLTLLGVVAEGAAVRSSVGGGTTKSAITFLPLLACILLFGTTASVLFFAVTGTVAEFFIRRKETEKAVFNVSQYIVSTTIAAGAFTLAGGEPLAAEGMIGTQDSFEPQVVPFAVFAVTFLASNNLLVLLAISLSSTSPVGSTFFQLGKRHAPAFVHAMLISPLGLLVAFLYYEMGVLGLAIGLFPLLFVRHSYLAAHQLERANRDLLQALVKAIETRDPYTMGHSVRVQQLSQRIGKELGLSERRLEELRTAALLHDIGKIEIMYEEILRKPGPLSGRERRIIESHVTRGVELLTSLTSFRSGVIEAVQHHHEFFDGTGYPTGLSGSDIPLAARIIQVSDAIDAMLSTRPYRQALSTVQVYGELGRCSGSQFDPEIVEVIRAQEFVEEHAKDVAELRGASPVLGPDDGDAVAAVLRPGVQVPENHLAGRD